jgi:hypothetical protein
VAVSVPEPDKVRAVTRGLGIRVETADLLAWDWPEAAFDGRDADLSEGRRHNGPSAPIDPSGRKPGARQDAAPASP